MFLPKEGLLLRIFVGEDDSTDHMALYEAIVMKARELNIAGATYFGAAWDSGLPAGFTRSEFSVSRKICQLCLRLWIPRKRSILSFLTWMNLSKAEW